MWSQILSNLPIILIILFSVVLPVLQKVAKGLAEARAKREEALRRERAELERLRTGRPLPPEPSAMQTMAGSRTASEEPEEAPKPVMLRLPGGVVVQVPPEVAQQQGKRRPQAPATRPAGGRPTGPRTSTATAGRGGSSTKRASEAARRQQEVARRTEQARRDEVRREEARKRAQDAARAAAANADDVIFKTGIESAAEEPTFVAGAASPGAGVGVSGAAVIAGRAVGSGPVRGSIALLMGQPLDREGLRRAMVLRELLGSPVAERTPGATP